MFQENHVNLARRRLVSLAHRCFPTPTVAPCMRSLAAMGLTSVLVLRTRVLLLPVTETPAGSSPSSCSHNGEVF
ncbi:hypothetical protein EK904_013128 [Melospiza melodia maxima]|nr:hypothetical protein EK904_013128 [Melospiza melodia maxima]